MATGHIWKRVRKTARIGAAVGVVLMLIGYPAAAKMDEPLGMRITPEVLEQAFPGADGVGEVTGAAPAAVRVTP